MRARRSSSWGRTVALGDVSPLPAQGAEARQARRSQGQEQSHRRARAPALQSAEFARELKPRLRLRAGGGMAKPFLSIEDDSHANEIVTRLKAAASRRTRSRADPARPAPRSRSSTHQGPVGDVDGRSGRPPRGALVLIV